MTLCAVMVGCEQPMEESLETIPPVPSSATTDEAMAEASAPPAAEEAPPTTTEISPPAVEAPPAIEPAPAIEPPAAEAPKEAAPAETPAAEQPKPDSAVKSSDKVRFVANTSLKVPTMMCPFSCWPKVKETLAAQPGVEAVQLAEQAKEGEINNPVVELKVKPGFDSDAAIAALKKVSFEDAVVVN